MTHAPLTSPTLAEDNAFPPVDDEAGPGVGTAVGNVVVVVVVGPAGPGTGTETVGLFVGAATGVVVPVGARLGDAVGGRVTTVCVTDATERVVTPMASLAAASKELPESDECTSLEYSSDEEKLVVDSDAATVMETVHVYVLRRRCPRRRRAVVELTVKVFMCVVLTLVLLTMVAFSFSSSSAVCALSMEVSDMSMENDPVSVVVGIEDGLFVGSAEGRSDGAEVGRALGSCVGFADGFLLGELIGPAVGCTVGVRVRTILGSSEGTIVGCGMGRTTGWKLGRADG